MLVTKGGQKLIEFSLQLCQSIIGLRQGSIFKWDGAQFLMKCNKLREEAQNARIVFYLILQEAVNKLMFQQIDPNHNESKPYV